MTGYNLYEVTRTNYLFFTGKGGVGKTSVACATAVSFHAVSRLSVVGIRRFFLGQQCGVFSL